MEQTITNYKLKDFLHQSNELREEYTNLLRYSKPKETKNELYKMKLRDVDFIKTTFSNGTDENIIKIVSLVQGISEKAVLNMKITEFFSLVICIGEQIERIIRNEQKVLTSKNPNFKWEAVQGSEKMAKFGIYNTLENLSGGDITKYEYIMDMSYDEVFTILYMKRLKEDLIEEMNKTIIQK